MADLRTFVFFSFVFLSAKRCGRFCVEWWKGDEKAWSHCTAICLADFLERKFSERESTERLRRWPRSRFGYHIAMRVTNLYCNTIPAPLKFAIEGSSVALNYLLGGLLLCSDPPPPLPPDSSSRGLSPFGSPGKFRLEMWELLRQCMTFWTTAYYMFGFYT